MARKTFLISPEQVKSLRLKVGLTQKQAAELVHVSLRQWQKFEESESSGTHVRIADATLELFCLKTGLSFPPNFSDGYHHGKVISFAGGAGGMGRSSLTRDMAILLANDGYDVLVIVNEKYSHLKLMEKYFIYSNQPYPKILFSEDVCWSGEAVFESAFSDIAGYYDFIFIDFEFGRGHLGITSFPVDLIITPYRLNNQFQVSMKNTYEFIEQKKQGKIENPKVQMAALLIDVSSDFTFNFVYHGLDYYLDNSQLKSIEDELKSYELKIELELLPKFNKLSEEGVYVFNSYTTKTYDFYSNFSKVHNGGNEAVMHYLYNQNTMAAHDLRAIKKEMLMLLGITGVR
ncbi:hypothetical protein [Shewanella sp. M-Br]|uniref:hypothetical protein n=1 Tax=Shewanella sp. M-Br TaxID=2495595 RepID=UPI002949647D|nr:hypothetical protein SMBr_14870 [Shewanella sp. M-Br]